MYAKALSKADGDKEKSDGIYLKLRVQSIMDDIESEQIDRRENERAYKAIQALESEKIVEPKFSSNEIKAECEYILNKKGYALYKHLFGDYWVGSIPAKGVDNQNYYESGDIRKIKEWAIDAKDLT